MVGACRLEITELGHLAADIFGWIEGLPCGAVSVEPFDGRACTSIVKTVADYPLHCRAVIVFLIVSTQFKGEILSGLAIQQAANVGGPFIAQCAAIGCDPFTAPMIEAGVDLVGQFAGDDGPGGQDIAVVLVVRRQRDIDLGLVFVQVRCFCDVVDGSGKGVAAEESRLRAFDHLDPFQVLQPDGRRGAQYVNTVHEQGGRLQVVGFALKHTAQADNGIDPAGDSAAALAGIEFHAGGL